MVSKQTTENKIMIDEKENGGGRLALDVFESARTLSCSVPTVRKFIRAKRLPRIEGIRKILVPVAALENFVTRNATTN
jgi:Helix-turn-helix domain